MNSEGQTRQVSLPTSLALKRFFFSKQRTKAGEMAQQLSALTALAEAPGLVPEFTCQFIVSGNPTPSCGDPAP